MVEGVYEVHAEFQPAFRVFAEGEILLDIHVEEMLRRCARIVEGARRAAERTFGRTHERRRIEIGFAVLSSRTTAIPVGVDQRHARNQVGTDGSRVSFDAKPVVVAQDDDHRDAALDAPDATETPAAYHRIYPTTRLPQELTAAANGQIPDPRRAEGVFDVEERNRTVL